MANFIPNAWDPTVSPYEVRKLRPNVISPVRNVKASSATDPVAFLEQSLGLDSDLDFFIRCQPGSRRHVMHLVHDLFRVAEIVAKEGNWVDTFYESADRVPHRQAIVEAETGRALTYGELDALSSQGVKPLSIIPLIFENSIDYVVTYLGVLKIGCCVAAINNNLRAAALIHCLKVATGDLIIFGTSLSEPIKAVSSELSARFVCMGDDFKNVQWTTGCCLADVLPFASERLPLEVRRAAKPTDLAMFIYTSGTTGNPKPVSISHSSIMISNVTASTLPRYFEDDRIYTAMPLYHSAAGNVAMSSAFSLGLTIIFAKKMSARNFFKHCIEHKATVIQYIGEIARYILATPPDPAVDRGHKVRVAIGNGMRSEIWGQFKDRFNIPIIAEFYGATDGIGLITHYNAEEETNGTLGKLGPLYRLLTGMRIIRFDYETEQPVRGEDGFVIECDPGEAGEIIADINPLKGRLFRGYHGAPEATEKKILRNAFRKDDAWIRSGDIVMFDRLGFAYFKDRIGDTFRWKGENCSTQEIGETIDRYPGIIEANVYGVEIPQKDGRCGMAGLQTESSFDVSGLGKFLVKELPKYAIPLFLRMLPEIQTTGTFKQVKTTLRAEGIDLNKIKDRMFFFDEEKSTYVPYTTQIYNDIMAGKARL
ncbi:hypothetical protein SmJEL517_g04408 [Synchytrium microbalum]|uniref:AMP-dependent synthetase/ligase domain-containing protein n=1 Tax=Synchytrium microbalum TaxID=1806994 RepID=A0A507C500_9FUNG|nr:uncharacterized protein SmJEL517_g04408 [Synchytrium microbalum]TPX32505.1 hypothetical protein SmJEL517_g04408 [Synchytrium microbalum]